ncbi:unnamed protein product [Paramecium octaurelia]|uniref:Uncharacterized protein n=1 Tax=Paramecium octaurelia TaxID=43137 RepID=A0A8S1SET7_PAROT|nr:unnamed protein product [Paramecium octaurelia]
MSQVVLVYIIRRIRKRHNKYSICCLRIILVISKRNLLNEALINDSNE